ncbi:hypothetical protein AAC387_Pa07g3692 [Persea americana]
MVPIPDHDAVGCAARAGEGTELRMDGWPSEQRRRAARVVLLPDPDMLLAVPPELVKAPSSGRLALRTEAPSCEGGTVTGP